MPEYAYPSLPQDPRGSTGHYTPRRRLFQSPLPAQTNMVYNNVSPTNLSAPGTNFQGGHAMNPHLLPVTTAQVDPFLCSIPSTRASMAQNQAGGFDIPIDPQLFAVPPGPPFGDQLPQVPLGPPQDHWLSHPRSVPPLDGEAGCVRYSHVGGIKVRVSARTPELLMSLTRQLWPSGVDPTNPVQMPTKANENSHVGCTRTITELGEARSYAARKRRKDKNRQKNKAKKERRAQRLENTKKVTAEELGDEESDEGVNQLKHEM